MTSNNPQTAQPNIFERPSRPMELDWYSSDERMDSAVRDLLAKLNVRGHQNNLIRYLRVILAAVLKSYKSNPNRYISYGRNSDFLTCRYKGKADPRNPERLDARKIIEIVDALKAIGFVESHTGGYGYAEEGHIGRLSRFKVTERFVSFIKGHKLLDIQLKQKPINGGMVLKDEKKKLIYDYSAYEGNSRIQRSKDILAAYNDLIANTTIKLEHQEHFRPIDFSRICTWRVFHNSSFELGGRFYGNWWMNGCKSEDRRYISINGQPTVELDYKANHLYMLYGLYNVDMPEELRNDPYKFHKYIPREVAKAIFTRLMNCQSQRGAWLSIEEAKEKEDNEELKMELRQRIKGQSYFDNYVVEMLRAHPLLKTEICINKGLELMNWDSKIAEYVIRRMTALGIPVLCVHDSFIIDSKYKHILRHFMKKAYSSFNIPKGLPEIKETVSLLKLDQDGVIRVIE
ncbi:MAG: hypothetical protein KDI13_07490 [Alphaproteobacteria bacterium]|nr:hypothetical protein [Alphaproteobacteria bacterium]